VTVKTVEPHGLAVNDRIFVTGTGTQVDGGGTTTASAVTAIFQVVSVTPANPPATPFYQFTYRTSSNGNIPPRTGFYRKHNAATFTRSGVW